MSLKETLDNRIKDAMRSKDQAALRALRAVKSAIMLVETSEGRTPGPLSADEEMAVLLKQAKQRKDSIEQFVKAGREDLAVGEREELVIIEEFLPKALTAEELEAEVKAIIAEVGATSAKDMGKVMGVASKRLAGRADGKLVSETVKKLLA
jgi:uncharacterized protein YqeY